MSSLQLGQNLFISDLHLSPSRPHITHLFLSFLEQRAQGTKTLFILGDLFDYWIGDDDPSAPRKQVISGLRRLSHSGTSVNIVHGNRDFLLAEQFATECGAHILSDCTVIDCDGLSTLLLHGDLLCSDDHTYQRFRELSRTEQWQKMVLGKPLWLRLGLVRWYRIRSYFHKRQQPSEIMDVNVDTVWQYANHYGVSRIIHGHTHRPGHHKMTENDLTLDRYVLGEWHRSAQILSIDSNGINFEKISLDSNKTLHVELLKQSPKKSFNCF